MKSNTGKRQNITLVASLVALTLLVAGCDTIETGAHNDETTNFGLYKSFSWIDDEPLFVGSDDTGIIISVPIGDGGNPSPLGEAKIV